MWNLVIRSFGLFSLLGNKKEKRDERAEKFVSLGKKILASGRNYYRKHGAEPENDLPTEPIIFLKPTSSYITQGQNIKLMKDWKEIHHEVELGVIIGKQGFRIPESQAMQHVGGYCLALDMFSEDLFQLRSKGLPWSLAKGFDTSCPVSDFIEKDKIPDPQNVDLWLKVNGELRQSANTKDMIFSIPYLLSYVSNLFTLEPGDVILTGTPEGIAPVKSGDVIECGLHGIAEMKFNVE